MAITTRVPDGQDVQTENAFLISILKGMKKPHKTIESKWLYDAKGSALFDQITELEAYYPTKTEARILEDRLPELASLVEPGRALLELGSGSSVKTRLVLDKVPGLSTYLPVDISEEHLLAAVADLAEDYPDIGMIPIVGDFTSRLAIPKTLDGVPKLLFFPGSTIGNFDTAGAEALLRRNRSIDEVCGFVVGFDLVKDIETLVRAYDDELGVTAAFNLNLLTRMNRELSADFDIDRFRHEARWNADESRIEMHLVSTCPQSVQIADVHFQFEAGETIHTENSHKYTKPGFEQLANRAGWDVATTWTDPEDLFAVTVLQPAPLS